MSAPPHLPLPIGHATWFTSDHAPYDLTFVLRPASLLAVAAAVVGAVTLQRAARRWPLASLRVAPAARLVPWLPRLLAIHAGVSLLALGLRGEFLAPSLPLPSTWWVLSLAVVEAILGVWLIVGVRVRPAAWVLVGLGPVGMLLFGVVPVLERLDLLGIAFFLAMVPPDDDHPAGRVRIDPARLPIAVLGLRLLVGSALILLAFTEKLARPALSLAFLEQHPGFNVARMLGVPLSDERFVQTAAAVELLVGVLLIIGVVPHVVAALAAVPFTLPVVVLGTPELIGHLPIYGALLVLVALGAHPRTAEIGSWRPTRAAAQGTSNVAPTRVTQRPG